MSESLSENLKRVSSQGGWKIFFFHAMAMLGATWLLSLLVDAAVLGRYPATFRAFTMTLAFALGLYTIPLLISIVLLRFKKIIGWISWVALVALQTYGYMKIAA